MLFVAHSTWMAMALKSCGWWVVVNDVEVLMGGGSGGGRWLKMSQ